VKLMPPKSPTLIEAAVVSLTVTPPTANFALALPSTAVLIGNTQRQGHLRFWIFAAATGDASFDLNALAWLARRPRSFRHRITARPLRRA